MSVIQSTPTTESKDNLVKVIVMQEADGRELYLTLTHKQLDLLYYLRDNGFLDDCDGYNAKILEVNDTIKFEEV